ncbi:anhydro-N-acetylmuramic acid kinase [Idiomarina sp. HP20-50]|uniref:anhydro-N-acetylmuramic acid kinase n=1 Tax=Idiomarina sp. HP20-50 TaxID=3070813 RepID=UPI00294B12BA|nr:anhydro-N-acetylmuramic acid kinase [Idiomarina sp. HP20-50]MDV6315574.1 anhydro-N-acetylmuramic acid kinase [Idiomarina sp. HP20-50]
MPERFIGLMSGTSMDAVDAALVQIDAQGLTLEAHYSLPIPNSLRSRLLNISHSDTWSADELANLDIAFSEHSAEAVNKLLSKANIHSDKIIAIASHGQTVRHKPNLVPSYTCQIGDPTRLALTTGIDVIYDFRRKDIAAGGQGAPLVPAFHQQVFGNKEQSIAVVNLGGIANVTWLGSEGQVQGFDTGPANTLLDQWVQYHHPNKGFDENAQFALSGKTQPSLLAQLLEHPFFSRRAPKSTGREDFNLNWLKRQLAEQSIAPEDVQHTLTELSAISIKNALMTLPQKPAAVYFCGGGTKNPLLMSLLAQLLAPAECDTTARLGVDPQWVEAMAFAWLGWCYEHKKPGNQPAVTGASRPVILGAKVLHQ